MSEKETAAEALRRIQSGYSANDERAVVAFAERGIDPAAIEPRVNVLKFKAWQAKGRRVAKGATGVVVTVWIEKRDKQTGKVNGRYPRGCRLFHVSQTVPADAPAGTKPEAWRNPLLVKPGTYAAADVPEADKLQSDDKPAGIPAGAVCLADLIEAQSGEKGASGELF